MLIDKIDNFSGDNGWLSNFYSCVIEFRGIAYISVEHAYMSAKSTDPKWKKRCANYNIHPSVIKKESRKQKLVNNWDEIKLTIMEKCLRAKFCDINRQLTPLLIDTGDTYLEEGNNWGDTFWGVCKGKGENNLGKLLMKTREELISG